ncbi:MAG: hypothetical protein KBH99_08635 [Syntrophobacteraceae bacterium]|nr:hypothetical protein [Syntrophobacteraceae bacterium]
MVITDYRIQSVLRTYSKQLQRSKITRRLDSEETRKPQEKVTISEEARRRVIFERVTSQAMEQICQQGEDSTPVEG